MSISTKIILADMIGAIDDIAVAVAGLCLGLLVIFGGIYTVGRMEETQDVIESAEKLIKRTLLCLAVAGLVNVIAPSRQVLAMAFAFEAVSEIEGMDKLPEKTIEALNTMLDEYIEQIKEDKEDEKERD